MTSKSRVGSMSHPGAILPQHEQCGFDPGALARRSRSCRWPRHRRRPSNRRGVHAVPAGSAGPGLVKSTVSKHRDNLWLPGGERIGRRHDDDELARRNVGDAIRYLIQGDGGPLIYPSVTEPEQDSLRATCRKLNRFMPCATRLQRNNRPEATTGAHSVHGGGRASHVMNA